MPRHFDEILLDCGGAPERRIDTGVDSAMMAAAELWYRIGAELWYRIGSASGEGGAASRCS